MERVGAGLRILLVTPAAKGSRKGNRVTAERWSRMLRSLGARVEIAEAFTKQNADLLIALHARKSAAAVARFHRRFPDRPIVLTLTGTDLYGDLRRSAAARRSVELADRLVVLQPLALRELTSSQRRKTRVILQSAEPPSSPPPPLKGVFEVCVVGHLRPVKDPFRAAMAARRLPAESRVRVIHLGAALSPPMEARARREMERNPRYRWLGELSHARTMRLLARSRLLVLSSRSEGGANVISEAAAAGTPVLASNIPGSAGLLGDDYPGLFPVGDTQYLTDHLHRSETDPAFYTALKKTFTRATANLHPAQEQESWRRLLEEMRQDLPRD